MPRLFNLSLVPCQHHSASQRSPIPSLYLLIVKCRVHQTKRMRVQDFVDFVETGRGLWLPIQKIEEINDIPSPISFYRDYVSRNMPVVIRGNLLTLLFYPRLSTLIPSHKHKQVDVGIGMRSRNGEIRIWKKERKSIKHI
jgi:hypothetical protein